MPRTGAFSLIETLLTIGVVAVLAVLLTGAVHGVRASADRTTAISQMRQIGLALQQYAIDHDGTLPGPLKVGQGAMYDPADTQRMATALGAYLGLTDLTKKTYLKIFMPPAVARAMKGTNLAEANPFVMNVDVTIDGAKVKPWGDDKDKLPPLKVGALPGGTMAFCDADRRNPLVTDQPWNSKTPPEIVHGKQRLALYFDASVGPIDSSLLKPKGGGGSGNPPPPPPPPKK